MTQHPTTHETPASLLAPLARGLLRRQPEILSLSIHDSVGHALWSSGDFLLPEDFALIEEVIEESVGQNRHDVRGQSCGLWWESADTARARCALAIFEGAQFRGVVLVAFSGLTTGEEDRAMRVLELTPVLPVLARALHQLPSEVQVIESLPSKNQGSDTTIVAALRFLGNVPDDGLACDIEALGREQHMLDLIDSALRDDEFALHLQPIVSLRDDKSPLIVEVLIRLPTQEFGVLASHEFLETAERNGRMPAIDRWADVRAVFSVNLSGKSVVRPDFRDYLELCLDKSGLPLDAIRFEVAELDAGIAPQEFAALARSLADRGCEVSVDNAGTGTGRFDFLRGVDADILKIDGSLVKGASDDLVSRALINGLVHMADTLGMRTVASQVDSTGKLRAVTQLGVDYAQGYRVQEPEHIDTFDFADCGIQRPLDAGARA